MKKPFKGRFIAFSAIALAFIVALYVLFVITATDGGTNLFRFIGEGIPELFKGFSSYPTETLIWVIVFLAFAFLGLVYLVLGIVLPKKKAAAKVVLALLGFFFAAIAFLSTLTTLVWCIVGVALGGNGLFAVFQHLGDIFQASTARGIVFLATYICVILAIVFLVLALVFGVKYARTAYRLKQELAQAAEPAPVEEVPAEYQELTADEPVPEFVPEPEPAEEKPAPAEEKKEDTCSMSELAMMIRDIVRDEIARNNANRPEPAQPAPTNSSVVGATFGGPLVVQYFNGGINGVTSPAPAPAPAPVEEKKEEPKEEPKPEPEPQPEPKPEPKPEPQPEPQPEPKPEPAPAPAPVEEKPAEPKAPIIRIPFAERLVDAEKEMQDNYNELKNEILSYGVKSRISNSGDTFRLHRKTYIKLTIAGKSLKLYFALDPADYADSTIPVQDASGKDSYAEIPLIFKVKSGLSMRRAKQLIQDCMEKDGLEQGEIGSVNWVKEVKAELKAAQKAEKK